MATTDAGPSSLSTAPNYAGAWTKLKPALQPALLHHVVSTLGFRQMTPVQASVVPLFLSHKDVIVEAVTGSGKTLAYALPALQMIMQRQERLKKSQIGALIVCPTRELAIQVHGIIDNFIQTQSNATENDEGSGQGPPSYDLHALLAVGGSKASPHDDFKLFKEHGSDFVIGTPGRVEELLKRPGVDTKELEVLILDEADRLLDMGFNQTVTSILRMLPKQRRTGLFSATMTDAMSELVRVGLRNPVRVVVKVESKKSMSNSATASSEKRTPATLDNLYASMRPEHKLGQLLRILRHEASEAQRTSDDGHGMRKAIVYFATCAQVNYFYKILSLLKTDLPAMKLYSLHGKQTPTRRGATFDAFVSATPIGGSARNDDEVDKTERSSILLCTDVAARGLDLPNVDLVVQFDPPTDPKVFSHRCGRTARAGRKGKAIVLLHKGREEEYVDFLRVRKSPVRPYGYVTDVDATIGEEPAELDPGALALHDRMRGLVESDRALYEAGMQAFVSFIQCYRKHEVSFVFRERDLALDGVAFTFALLRFPRMPEVDRWRKEHDGAPLLLQERAVDLRTFAYADKLREQQRLAVQETKRQGAQAATPDAEPRVAQERKRKSKAMQAEEAWSDQKARKERKQVRREKKQRKRAYLSTQKEEQEAQAESNATKAGQGKGDDADEDDDNVDDWAMEEKLAKKARKANVQADNQFADL